MLHPGVSSVPEPRPLLTWSPTAKREHLSQLAAPYCVEPPEAFGRMTVEYVPS